MKYKLFIIRDLKAESIAGPILIFPREAPAIRYFHDQLKNKDSQVGQHPEDYTLYEIGTIEEETGRIEGMVGETTDGHAFERQPQIIAEGRGWATSQLNEK